MCFHLQPKHALTRGSGAARGQQLWADGHGLWSAERSTKPPVPRKDPHPRAWTPSGSAPSPPWTETTSSNQPVGPVDGWVSGVRGGGGAYPKPPRTPRTPRETRRSSSVGRGSVSGISEAPPSPKVNTSKLELEPYTDPKPVR